jgi:hypothetical protein
MNCFHSPVRIDTNQEVKRQPPLRGGILSTAIVYTPCNEPMSPSITFKSHFHFLQSPNPPCIESAVGYSATEP